MLLSFEKKITQDEAKKCEIRVCLKAWKMIDQWIFAG